MTAASDETGRKHKRDAYIGVLASLAAAISLLERTPRSKKAAASDKMFDQMIADYKKALDEGRAALSASPVAQEPVAWQYRYKLPDQTWSTWQPIERSTFKLLVPNEQMQSRCLYAASPPATPASECGKNIARLESAIEGVIRVADRKTVEFDAAKEALRLSRGGDE